ncbi:MAG: SDR family oxidoreductase [Micromonosporaceae bacterium]
MKLTGAVVVITGGARGIGAALAARMRREGARVAIGDLDLALAEQTAAQIGGDVLALPLDVTDHAGFTAFLDQVEQRLGPIDVLINNAGIMPVNLLERESPETTARLLAINLQAVVHGTREALKRMKPRVGGHGAGHIVNIASSAGKTGVPGIATYSATKHGVVGLSDAVRHELRGSGVRISVVLPAVVRTELTTGVPDTKLVPTLRPEHVAKHVVAAVRTGRFEVYVPPMAGRMERLTRLFPRSVSDWLLRLIGADRVMLEAAESADRAGYEARAARSAPGADGAAEADGGPAAATQAKPTREPRPGEVEEA